MLERLASGGSSKILVIHDGNKGHLKQSMSLVAKLKQHKDGWVGVDTTFDVKVIEAKFKSWSMKAFIKVFNPYLSPRHPFQKLLLPACMVPESLAEIMAQTPDIIISCGAAGSGVSTMLKKKAGARNIVILNPGFVTRDDFDLVIVPRHDVWEWKPFKQNVVITDLALNPVTPASLERTRAEATAEYGPSVGTSVGLLIGGNNRSFRFTQKVTETLLQGIIQLCTRFGGGLYCTTSRRTPRMVDRALEDALKTKPFCRSLIKGRDDIDPATVEKILACSDVIVVSGESISMVSEAISSGKPVVVFMPQKVLPVYTKYEKFIKNLVQKGFVTKVGVEELGGITPDRLTLPAENPAVRDECCILGQCRQLFTDRGYRTTREGF